MKLDPDLAAQLLAHLRVDLYAAAQRLEGEQLEQFQMLICEIAQYLDVDLKRRAT